MIDFFLLPICAWFGCSLTTLLLLIIIIVLIIRG